MWICGYSLNNQDVTAYEAKKYAKYGFRDKPVQKKLKDAGVSPREAKGFVSYGLRFPAHILPLKERGLGSFGAGRYVRRGYTVGQIMRLKDAGIGPREAGSFDQRQHFEMKLHSIRPKQFPINEV